VAEPDYRFVGPSLPGGLYQPGECRLVCNWLSLFLRPARYTRFLSWCGIGYLLIALTAAITNRHWYEMDNLLPGYNGNLPAYRVHSSSAPAELENWLRTHPRESGPDLTRLSRDPDFLHVLQTQEFYKWKFDEAVQMPRKAVIFGFQGRAWQPMAEPLFSSHSVSRRACRCAPLRSGRPRNKSGSVTVVPLRSCMERSIAARRMFRRSMTSGGPSLTGLKTCESEFPSFEPTLWYLVKRNHHHPSNSSCYSNCDATHRNRSVGARTGKDIAIAGFTALKNHH